MIVASAVVALCAVSASAQHAVRHTLAEHYTTGDDFMSVGLRGAIALPYTKLDGFALVELSGLAWDEDEQLLYALSDNGHLFHLRPRFESGHLVDVEVVAAHALLDAQGAKLLGTSADSEGLAAVGHSNGREGDTRLLVSFERVPRLAYFNPHGQLLETLALPAELTTTYSGSNKGFESVTMNVKGDVLFAPEWPLPHNTAPTTALYSLKGKRWMFPRYPAPLSSVVALESMPDGSVLVLERSYTSIWQPLRIVLRQTRPLTETGDPVSIARELVVFNSFDGWQIDNFEGLTLHRPDHLFLVSDDNAAWPQKTLLLYLEILDSPTKKRPTTKTR